jgi:hypothetical protein
MTEPQPSNGDIDLSNLPPFDAEADRQLARDAQAAPGWYQSVPESSYWHVRRNTAGRIYVTGSLALSKLDDSDERTRVDLFFSPERRDRDDEPGKPDRMSITYVSIMDAYTRAHQGQRATGMPDLMLWLQAEPLQVRLTRGRTSPFVAAIRPVVVPF